MNGRLAREAAVRASCSIRREAVGCTRPQIDLGLWGDWMRRERTSEARIGRESFALVGVYEDWPRA